MHQPERLLTGEETAAYLRRIGVTAPPTALGHDRGTLDALQSAHARTVPFENLDIVAGVSIALDLDHLIDKVVRRQRGGFCYELNGLFHALLTTLGFDAWLVEARSPTSTDGPARLEGSESRGGRSSGGLGPRFDHARVLVALDGGLLLVDVGNGASSLVPIDLADTTPVDTGPSVVRVVRDGTGWRTDSLDRHGDWVQGWCFDDVAQPLSAFAERCRFQESDPSSHFTQGLICSLPTPTGKVTLTDDRLITTVDGQRTEVAVDDVRVPLREVFGIHWDGETAPR